MTACGSQVWPADGPTIMASRSSSGSGLVDTGPIMSVTTWWRPIVSRLIVERRELWGRDRFRRYQLVLDDQPSGSVGHRDHDVIEVAPGTHHLQARMDHFERDVITFTVPDDDDVHLELRAKILGTTGVAASTVAWSM